MNHGILSDGKNELHNHAKTKKNRHAYCLLKIATLKGHTGYSPSDRHFQSRAVRTVEGPVPHAVRRAGKGGKVLGEELLSAMQ